MPSKKKNIPDGIDWRLKVFESLSFPTLILRPNKVIMHANQIFLDKYSEYESIRGKKCHQVFYNSNVPCPESICPFNRVISEKKGCSVLRKTVDKHNREVWEDRVFSLILDDDGEVMYIMESVRDVTKVKNLEKELKKTKEFFESVIQSSVSPIVTADRKGNILYMNQAAEDFFGYTIEEALLAMNVEDLYPSGIARNIMKMLRDENIGGKGKLPSTKISIKNSNGEEIPTELTAAIIYEDGQEVATMGIYSDLREKLEVERKLKEAHAQLVQSEKMASMGQLAAGIAHEINNPLGGIMLYANLALERLEKNDPMCEDLEFIIEDTKRCTEIVKNLLAYSRQTSPSKTIIQLNALVDQSLLLIRDQKLFRNIVIQKRLSDEMMLINTDKDQLCQVIINLVINAIAAMDGDGVLTFFTYRDKLRKKIYLEISDNGKGIPEENLSKIFDPFFTTKEPGKGTGLGLSTSYGIIKENGGNIAVKETGPDGTTFIVELPIYQPSDAG